MYKVLESKSANHGIKNTSTPNKFKKDESYSNKTINFGKRSKKRFRSDSRPSSILKNSTNSNNDLSSTISLSTDDSESYHESLMPNNHSKIIRKKSQHNHMSSIERSSNKTKHKNINHSNKSYSNYTYKQSNSQKSCNTYDDSNYRPRHKRDDFFRKANLNRSRNRND